MAVSHMTYHDGLGGPALDCEFVGHLIAILRQSARSSTPWLIGIGVPADNIY